MVALGNSKAEVLAALRTKVEGIERRPILVEEKAASAGFLATPPGCLHEVFADTPLNAAAALGFALGQARTMRSSERPAVLILQLISEAQETGTPYALGLGAFGLSIDDVVLVRSETIGELLWAMEEAVVCRAVAAVIADFAYPQKALDFTVSRRLSLRAAAAGSTIFLLRYARDREASAARYRWKVTPRSSQPVPFDNRAPGNPRWEIVLEKGSLARRRADRGAGEVFVVDWTENGFVLADIFSRDAARAPAVAALPHAAPAPLGDRLSQTG